MTENESTGPEQGADEETPTTALAAAMEAATAEAAAEAEEAKAAKAAREVAEAKAAEGGPAAAGAAPADDAPAAPTAEAVTDAESAAVGVEAADAAGETVTETEVEVEVVVDEVVVDELDPDALRALVSTPAKDLRLQATGKRKTSVARVIVTPGKGDFWINGRNLEEYFPRQTLRTNVMEPMLLTGAVGAYHVRARLHGGGISSQSGALRHGISRALAEIDPQVRRQLKTRGFLKLDARQVERKKAGLKKARKRPQFSKR